MSRLYIFTTLLTLGIPAAEAAADQADLAKQTLNPVASLVSLPLQLNYNENIGPADEGEQYTLNVQPVIPFTLNPDWNLITRTIIPLIDQKNILPGGAADESGLGDVNLSLFFSPKQPSAGGWIWGIGSAFLLPTASDELLGTEKWGAGPTMVALKQDSGWTYGVLTNHIESFAGENDRNDISATFIQPFLSYTTKTFTTFGVNTESTYDWEGEEWSVPVNLTLTQLLRVGQQPLSLQFGVRQWAESPPNGPEDMGFRFAVTFLFPK